MTPPIPETQPKRPEVIRKRADFLAANKGLRVARPGFILLARPNGLEPERMRYGITVTKRIGNAVVRNRMKRRFRELLWAALPTAGLPGHDFILIGREGGIERDFTKLSEELAMALSRAREGKGDPPRGPRKPGGRRSGPRSGGANRSGKSQAAPA
ncbi:MAG TPA: ribonuclease P protein component [Croceicoccus sp.]|nr:ribonuclease P protein component [Croceicoccus sp.]